MKGPSGKMTEQNANVVIQIKITVSNDGRMLFWAEDEVQPPRLGAIKEAVRAASDLLGIGQYTITQGGYIEAEGLVREVQHGKDSESRTVGNQDDPSQGGRPR